MIQTRNRCVETMHVAGISGDHGKARECEKDLMLFAIDYSIKRLTCVETTTPHL